MTGVTGTASVAGDTYTRVARVVGEVIEVELSITRAVFALCRIASLLWRQYLVRNVGSRRDNR